MANLRTVLTFAVPAVTALFGLLWIFRKKKAPVRKKLTYEDKTSKVEETGNFSKDHAKIDLQGDGNNSADDLSIAGRSSEKEECEVKPDILDIQSELPDVLDKQSESEQIAQSDGEVVEEITAVLEPVLKSETVLDTMANPENINEEEKGDRPSAEDVSSRNDEAGSVSDTLISQIIVADNVVSSIDNEKDTKEVMISNNEIDQSEDVSVTNLSETNDQITRLTELCGTEPGKSTHMIDSMSPHSVVENDLDKQEAESPKQEDSLTENVSDSISNEPTQMSRSWHKDVEESEKKDSNGCSEEKEAKINDRDPDSAVLPSDSDHQVQSDSNAKLAENNKEHLSKDQSSLSPPSKNSSPVSRNIKQAKEESLNHSETSSNCDNSSEASNDSGKGGSVGDSLTAHQDEDRVFEFNIPSEMCGLFIGTRGKTIKQTRDQSGARIRLKNNPYTRDYQICVVEGTEAVINKACKIIKRKFPSINIPGIDVTPVSNTVIMPEIMQLSLPDSISIDVVVSSIVDAGRVFVQQPTHPSFPSLERLNSFMNQCYHQDGAVPDIPKPIESGVICAAPMLNGWYRAQIMVYYEETDECDIKYVDYGGYSRISSRCLKQIRSDFMTLPFEAVECYLANVTPLESETYFSSEAAVVLEELTQGKMLQAQVVGKAEDGIPYIHIYQISGPSQTLLVNREMVNRGVVRWLELLS